MDKQPLVSIAICVYNGEKYLRQQLDSIFNQQYSTIEVVAVDDCSTDASRQILLQYQERYPNLKLYFNDVNLGYVKNFEKAITLCTGDLIALSDQDDIWHPQKIQKQVDQIGDHLLIYHNSAFIDGDGNSLNKSMTDLLNLYQGNSPLPFVFMNSVSGHTVLFKRQLAEYALPFNPAFFHDWWLAFVAGAKGSIKAINEPLVEYRQHPQTTIDILHIKENEAQQKTHELLSKQAWVAHCSNFDSDHSVYLKEISELLHPGLSLRGKLKLYMLLAKNKTDFRCISKLPAKSQLKIIRKLVFNIK